MVFVCGFFFCADARLRDVKPCAAHIGRAGAYGARHERGYLPYAARRRRSRVPDGNDANDVRHRLTMAKTAATCG